MCIFSAKLNAVPWSARPPSGERGKNDLGIALRRPRPSTPTRRPCVRSVGRAWSPRRPQASRQMHHPNTSQREHQDMSRPTRRRRHRRSLLLLHPFTMCMAGGDGLLVTDNVEFAISTVVVQRLYRQNDATLHLLWMQHLEPRPCPRVFDGLARPTSSFSTAG